MPTRLSGGSSGPLSLRSRRWWRRYARETRRPTHILVFLLPLLLIHELAVAVRMARGGPGGTLIAYGMIQELLGWIGLVGGLVPGLAYLAILVAWQQLKHDSWRVQGRALGIMLIESAALAIPLLVWTALFTPPPHVLPPTLGSRIILAVGAGLYEELVFRFLLIGGLTWIAIHPLQLPPRASLYAAVAIAALVFAVFHFRPVGGDVFGWALLIFRTAAGVYLSVVYLARGLGVSTGCHVLHNVVLALLAGETAA